MAITGNQVTINFGTSGFTANFIEIQGPEESREALENSHLGTSGHKTYQPDDLIEPGESAARYYWDQSFGTFPPIDQDAETITITYPLKSGESTNATLAGTGFLTRRKGGDAVNGELMVGELTIKWDGETGPTYTAGS